MSVFQVRGGKFLLAGGKLTTNAACCCYTPGVACAHCPGGTPAQFLVTFSGITTCTACEPLTSNLNFQSINMSGTGTVSGTITLTQTSACEWEGTAAYTDNVFTLFSDASCAVSADQSIELIAYLYTAAPNSRSLWIALRRATIPPPSFEGPGGYVILFHADSTLACTDSEELANLQTPGDCDLSLIETANYSWFGDSNAGLGGVGGTAVITPV